MPLTVRSSAGRRRRRKKTPDEKRPGESTSAQVMAPTRMKLRVRRRDGAAAGGSQPPAEEEEKRSRESRSSSRRKNANNSASTSAAAAADTTSPPSTSTTTSTVATTSTRAMVAAEDASPDSKCPICLDRFNNLAYLDRCLHRFCFPCIQEWSHNKAECPLCKQPFTSILHSVRAEDDFKEYTLRPPPANSSVAATVAMVAAMVSAARNDPRMLRLMLRRNRAADGDGGGSAGESLIRRTRRERGGRGGRGAGVWEMYFDSPTLPLASLSPSLAADDGGEGEELGRQANRRRPDPGRGVIFDGLTGPRASRTHNDRTYRRLMTRLVARRRQQQEGGAVRRLRERETVAFRRGLYRCGIRVHGVAGAGMSQQCDISADSFRHNPAHLNKLRPWLRRELTVLYGAHNSLVDIVQRIITAQLSRHGLEDMPTIEDELRPFLLARTDHFLHELVSFARSPLALEQYDLQAAYEPPAAAMELEGMSSPSDSSSVIAISEGEEEEPVGGRSADAHRHDDDDVIQAGSCLSLSAWDDETPGPSYSTAEPSCPLTPLASNSTHPGLANEEGEKVEEECLIVGYKKPIAERTPELVQLSSDTEEDDVKAKKEEEEEPAERKALPLPCATTSPPLSIPPSTSSAFREEQDESLKEKAANEVAAACRSWSPSSGRSHESVCSLSGGEHHLRRDWTLQDGDDNSRRRRKRRGRTPPPPLEKRGTLYNPNRSIYPAMMCRRPPHTPSPFHSSAESGSPLPPSPLDSSWDFNCSSLSSSPTRAASSSSSSPLCLSPQLSSPHTPSISPSGGGEHDAHDNREKPGGKRKYKSRHLDRDDKDPTWRPSAGGQLHERRRDGESRKRKARDGRRRRRRKESSGYRGDSSSSRKCRNDRSPSVEIVYERSCDAAPPPSRKRRRKGHRSTQHSSSPVIITLDSDSSRDDAAHSSSSPLSSQQTVDFSDLPPLPLVHSVGVGGALDEDVGDLPVHILDRRSDGSEEAEPARRPRPIDVGSDSDHDIDVENDGGEEPSASVREPITALAAARNKLNRRKSTGKKGGSDRPATNLHKSASPSDSRLLAAILEDLKGIVAPQRDLPLTFDPSCSPDSRRRRHSRNPCEADGGHLKPDAAGDHPELKDQSRDSELPTCSSSAPSLSPPPPQHQQQQTRHMDVPPLLKRASPVRSHNRNTPPPLKHKDAGSPRLSPLASLLSDVDSRDSNSTPPLVAESRLPLNATDVIPPISTLKKHFAGPLALRGVPGAAGGPAAPADIGNHKPPVDAGYRSSLGSDDGSERTGPLLLPISFYSPSLHSGCDGWPPPGLRFPPVNFLPANSIAPVNNCHSIEPGWSKAAHANSTSVGPGEKTVGQCSSQVPPDDFCVARDVVASSGGFSNHVSSTLLASTVEVRTQNSSLPVEDLSLRSRSPVDFHSMEPGWSRPAHMDSTSQGKKTVGLSSSRVPPDDFHGAEDGGGLSNHVSSALLAPNVEDQTRSSFSPVDSHSSSKGDVLSQRTDDRTSSMVNHLLPSDAILNCHGTTARREGRLNHAALPSSAFDAMDVEDSSGHVAKSQPKLRNHFDATSASQIAMDSKSSRGDFERDGRVAGSDASGDGH